MFKVTLKPDVRVEEGGPGSEEGNEVQKAGEPKVPTPSDDEYREVLNILLALHEQTPERVAATIEHINVDWHMKDGSLRPRFQFIFRRAIGQSDFHYIPEWWLDQMPGWLNRQTVGKEIMGRIASKLGWHLQRMIRERTKFYSDLLGDAERFTTGARIAIGEDRL